MMVCVSVLNREQILWDSFERKSFVMMQAIHTEDIVPAADVISREMAKARMQQMHKITLSNTFAKSPRLCSFLAYVVKKSVEGDIDGLTEQQIGIHVFQRSPGYNSSDDNIVRGTARHLRQRLEMYYRLEGTKDSVLIEIPKGAYVAHFEETVEGATVSEMDSVDVKAEGRESSEPASVAAWPKNKRKLWAAVAVAIFIVMGCLPILRARFEPADTSALLWKTLFVPGRTTFLVPGDAGLNMYEVLANRSVDLDSYTQQSYIDSSLPSSGGTLADVLGRRSYTTMSDLQLVSMLSRLPQADPAHTQVRFARDLAARDIHDANLVLMGSHSYNPWTELFQSGLSLQLSWDVNQDLFTITNRAPKPGESAVYQWTPKTGRRGGLTLISLTNNSQGNGRVLLVEGTTMFGGYAGSEFLANKELLDPILLQAKRPDGGLRNFEVLLQSDFIHEGVSNIKILAVHVH